MKISFKDFATYFFSLFFPNRCIFCDRLIDPFEDYCDECENTVHFISGEICKRCGMEKADCNCKSKRSVGYDAVAAPLYYDGDVKSCIRRYKFKDRRNMSKALAKLMYGTLKERFADIDFDYVTYIPMFPKKERARGFNQSRLLAREISELSGIPFGDNMLIKLYDTDNQHDCTGLERTGNLIGVFDFSGNYDVKDKTVLLIDDVKTSGATLKECGKMLYLNDANSVICLTAAIRNSKIESQK